MFQMSKVQLDTIIDETFAFAETALAGKFFLKIAVEALHTIAKSSSNQLYDLLVSKKIVSASPVPVTPVS